VFLISVRERKAKADDKFSFEYWGGRIFIFHELVPQVQWFAKNDLARMQCFCGKAVEANIMTVDQSWHAMRTIFDVDIQISSESEAEGASTSESKGLFE